jgi:hypothetical protein
MKSFQKRLSAILCMVVLSICLAVAQTNTIKHTVDRGETLTSIAKRYATTEAKIIELNPDANQFVYVGMELLIPIVSSTPESGITVDADNSKKSETSNASYTTDKEYKTADNSAEESQLRFCMEIGYGFLDKIYDGGSAFAYEATVGVNYTAIADLYVGGRIGYNSSYYSYNRITQTYHLLSIPIEVGYIFATADRKFGFIPFAGFDFNIGLSGNYKDKSDRTESTKFKIGGKLGVDFKVGIRLRLYEFNISAGYHIPTNDWQKTYFGNDAYPEVSLGFGF